MSDVYLPSTNQPTTGLDMSVTLGFCYARQGCNGLLHPNGKVHTDGRPICQCDVCGSQFVRQADPIYGPTNVNVREGKQE